MNKLYRIEIKGVVTKEGMESFALEVNNCEFCNTGKFVFNIKEFSYDKKGDIGVGLIEIIYGEDIEIEDALKEMIFCEFCHNYIEYMSLVPIVEKEALKPDCYTPNNGTYALCKGNNKEECNHCALYENMIEPYDYI